MQRPVVLNFAPEAVRTPAGPCLRFRCPAPAGCAWSHEEPTDPGPIGRLNIGDGSPAAISAALTANADERGRQLWERVTEAVAGHVTEAHHEVAWTVGMQQQAPPRPVPTYPYPAGHEREKVARFPCPRGCDWTVDASTDLGPARMEAAPPDRIAQVQARLQEQTTRLVDAFWSVVTGAIDAHVAEAHHDGAAPPVRPECEFPFPAGHPLVRTARFRCPHGCDWYRDESTDLAPSTVTAVTDHDGVGGRAELNRQTGARVEEFWARVNGAVEEHVAEAHPDTAETRQ